MNAFKIRDIYRQLRSQELKIDHNTEKALEPPAKSISWSKDEVRTMIKDWVAKGIIQDTPDLSEIYL